MKKFLFLFLMAGMLGADDDDGEVAAKFDLIHTLVQAGEFAQAEEALSEIEPENSVEETRKLVLMADVYSNTRRWKEARAALQRLDTVLDKDNPDIKRRLQIAEGWVKHESRASAKVAQDKANALIKAGKNAEALAALAGVDKEYMDEKEKSQIWESCGIAMSGLKDWDGAKRSFSEAKALRPGEGARFDKYIETCDRWLARISATAAAQALSPTAAPLAPAPRALTVPAKAPVKDAAKQ